jgi:hypothetical protein
MESRFAELKSAWEEGVNLPKGMFAQIGGEFTFIVDQLSRDVDIEIWDKRFKPLKFDLSSAR